MLKWLSGNIVDKPGRVGALSFLGAAFGEVEVLVHVARIRSLVNFFIVEVDGVETEADVAVVGVVWVLFE